MKPELAFVLLFLVASVVAIASGRLRIPYTVALVVAGLVLGSVHLFEPPHLTKELVYVLCLPGLLFEAAFHLDAKSFWRNKMTVVGLAVPGLIAAIALTALALTPIVRAAGFAAGFGFRHALVFAALIAATDPIAVVALFKSLGAPKRLGVLVEAESLLNDGTAVVVFGVLLDFALGTPTTLGSAALSFMVTVGMGVIIGGGVGLLGARMIKFVDDPMIEITLTTAVAYGSFALAEQFHFSGVIATVTAGMVVGTYTHTGMSATTRIAVMTFWEYVAFALNSLVFLLIGFEVRISALIASWQPILVAWIAVMLSRAVVVAAATGVLRFTREKLSWQWATVMTWGGVRGALSMVLVLSLAPDFPHRDLLVNMTFGVVTLTLLVQGMTMAPLLARLGITSGDTTGKDEYELRRGTVVVARAALDALPALTSTDGLPADMVAALRSEHERNLTEAKAALDDLRYARSQLRQENLQAARRHILHAQRDALYQAKQRGIVSQHAFEEILGKLDTELLSIEEAQPTPVDHREPSAPGERVDRPRQDSESGRG